MVRERRRGGWRALQSSLSLLLSIVAFFFEAAGACFLTTSPSSEEEEEEDDDDTAVRLAGWRGASSDESLLESESESLPLALRRAAPHARPHVSIASRTRAHGRAGSQGLLARLPAFFLGGAALHRTAPA